MDRSKRRMFVQTLRRVARVVGATAPASDDASREKDKAMMEAIRASNGSEEKKRDAEKACEDP